MGELSRLNGEDGGNNEDAENWEDIEFNTNDTKWSGEYEAIFYPSRTDLLKRCSFALINEV